MANGTDGNDFVTQELYYKGVWKAMHFGYGGNDTYYSYASNLGQEDLNELFSGFRKSYLGYQRHIYAGSGDDTINLIFSKYTGDEQLRFGHHLWTDSGDDIINFQGIENINTGMTVVGRIEDFDITRDRMQIDGKDIDLNNLPENIRVLEYNGAYFDKSARPQQWLEIMNQQGGRLFYALEGARSDYYAYGNDETHFIGKLPDFEELVEVEYEDTHATVAYEEYKDLDPTKVAEYFSRDYAAINTTYGKLNTQGSDDPDRVDVIHGGAGYDYIYAKAGNDLIAGGNSTDYIYGGEGDDKAWAGTEEDEVYGGKGNDYIEGNYGEDLLIGGDGYDTIYGGEGDDVVYGDSHAGENGKQIWELDRIGFTHNFFKDVQYGSEYTVSGLTDYGSFIVEDDDGVLQDNVNSYSSGQTRDISSQELKMDGAALLEGTYVYSRGYFDIKNLDTGQVGKLYQIRMDRDYDGKGIPGTDREMYKFENDFKYDLGDKLKIVSGIHAKGDVDYSEIGKSLYTPSLLGGRDEIHGGEGNDIIYGGANSDLIFGGDGDDVIYGDEDVLGDDKKILTDEQTWKLDQVAFSDFIKNVNYGSEFTVPDFADNKSFLITDDDGVLQDNNNSYRSGQTRDSTFQELKTSSEGFSEGTYVYSRGYFDIKNLETGQVGKLYQLRLDRDYIGQGMPGTDGEVYKFENDFEYDGGDRLRIVSGIHAKGDVDYSEIGQQIFGPNETGGNDEIFGGAGNDKIYGMQGDDRFFGGEGRDQFITEIGGGVDKIADFEFGIDKCVIKGDVDQSKIYKLFEEGRTGQEHGLGKTSVVIDKHTIIEFENTYSEDDVSIEDDFIFM